MTGSMSPFNKKSGAPELLGDFIGFVESEKGAYFKQVGAMLQSEVYRDQLCEDLEPIRGFERILDIGVGCGVSSLLLGQNNVSVVGLDILEVEGASQNRPIDISDKPFCIQECWSWIQPRHPGVQLLPFDGKNLISFANGHFDAVVMYAVLEHVQPDKIADLLNEIHRVLKCEGNLYIFRLPRVFSWQEFVTRNLKLGAHDKLYRKQEAIDMLLQHGFRTDRIEYYDLTFSYPSSIANKLKGIFRLINRYLISTPLKYLAHDFKLHLTREEITRPESFTNKISLLSNKH